MDVEDHRARDMQNVWDIKSKLEGNYGNALVDQVIWKVFEK